MLTLAEAKKNFFDRKVVQDAVDEGSRRELSKLGSFARTTARRSIKKARRMKPSEMSPEMAEQFKGRPAKERPLKSSEPGEPPRGRTGRLKAGILYAFDPSTKSAVAGPTKFAGSSDAQATLELGGSSEIVIAKIKKRSGRKATEKQRLALAELRRSGRLKSRKADKETVKVQVKPRPYMRPTLAVVAPMMPKKFKNLISG